MADERLSNVVGAPFAEHVLTQLDIRVVHNSTGRGSVSTRPNQDVLFLANKTGWAKLSSSVRLVANNNSILRDFYTNLGLGSNYSDVRDLAKNWILQSGTSISNGSGVNLRKGIGLEGSYGMGGTEELGYRPMPGLTSVIVDTKGTLGSLREATINFKVWNMNQLNVIEALYFRLGYSMILEWGHTQFFVNKGPFFGTFETNVGGIDPFQPRRKETIQQEINKLARQYSGNYDGMLGIVSNYTWSFNQEGGYDCTLKLIGLGAILDSLKINLSFKMPDVVFQEYTTQQQELKKKQEEDKALQEKLAAQKAREAQGLPPTIPSLPTNPSEIYTNIYKTDIGNPNPATTEQQFLADRSYYTAYDVNEGNANSVYDYFYKADVGGNPPNQRFIAELNKTRTGLFLSPITNQRSNWQVLFADTPPPVTLSAGALNLVGLRNLNSIYDPTRALGLADPWTGRRYNNEDLTKALGQNVFVKLFDLTIRDSKGGSVNSAVNNILDREVDPDEKIFAVQSAGSGNFILQFFNSFVGTLQQDSIKMELSYKALVKGVNGTNLIKQFYVVVTYTPPRFIDADDPAEKVRLTRRELITAFEEWFNSSKKVNILNVEPYFNPDNNQRDVLIRGKLDGIVVPNKGIPDIEIFFNNSGIIQTVLPPPLPPSQTIPQAIQAAITGDDNGQINQAESSQIDPSQRFASALHAMLYAVKSQMLSKSLTLDPNQIAYKDSIESLTSKLYQGTIFEDIINQSVLSQAISTVGQSTNPNGVPFDLTRYALKGFNSNLMGDQLLFDTTPSVNFKNLCLAYGVRYRIQNDNDQFNFPIYIKFGYLLAFITSMCLVYDSTQDTDKHPYVYIDFNPNTNLCLTTPQHMSVDPLVCLIPYQGTQDDYLKLFPEAILKLFKTNTTNVFGNNDTNRLSGLIDSFKTAGNQYQGKTMEILLNVDFIIQTLNQYTNRDPQNSINLKGFLDAIVNGVNKATGKINLFRVSYRDDTNTVIIKDDQFVPPLDGESYMLYKNSYLTNGTKGKPKYGMLPVFGAQSLVREMEFKTNLTTNISNQVAISAQAFTGSANSSDYSPFSYLNIASVNFEDSFKPRVSDSSDTVNVPTAIVTGSESKDLSLAQQFNTHVLSIYYGGEYVSKERISTAINYYIDGMAGVKSTNQVTVAAPPIPANLSITIDGISGIVMGNAFTIPEDRLPLSLRGTDNQTRVGFIVVGLTHTIDQNQWLTKIRGQMIRLRDNVTYGAPAVLQQQDLVSFGITGTVSTGCDTSYPELPQLASTQLELVSKTEVARYLKQNYPDIGKQVFAIVLAEAKTVGDNFRSAGGFNFGGVQTDSGRWGFGTFSGRFCKRDNGGNLREFAAFPSYQAFLDFVVNRTKAKGFANAVGDTWTTLYINKWWSPPDKLLYTRGTEIYNNKLAIFNSAQRIYDSV